MAAALRAHVIRHVAFEDLGSFTAVLEARGYAISMFDAGVDDLGSPTSPPDLLIVLGGPIGACEEAQYPFLTQELGLIEGQIAADKPVLGVCLGGQLIARALGAAVYAGAKKEIGWAPIDPSPAGAHSCLAPLVQNAWHVLHWHGDTFDLPQGAVRLASTPTTENQAFSYGPNTLALQFHVEARPRTMERWLIGHAVELAQAGLDVAKLRADTARWGEGLEQAGAKVLETWLEGA